MRFFKRETPEEKKKRIERKRQLDKAYKEAKFAAQLEAAKRDGRRDGLKGKRGFMERLSDVGEAAGKSMKIMEEAIGEIPSDSGTTKNSKEEKKSLRDKVMEI